MLVFFTAALILPVELGYAMTAYHKRHCFRTNARNIVLTTVSESARYTKYFCVRCQVVSVPKSCFLTRNVRYQTITPHISTFLCHLCPNIRLGSFSRCLFRFVPDFVTNPKPVDGEPTLVSSWIVHWVAHGQSSGVYTPDRSSGMIKLLLSSDIIE